MNYDAYLFSSRSILTRRMQNTFLNYQFRLRKEYRRNPFHFSLSKLTDTIPSLTAQKKKRNRIANSIDLKRLTVIPVSYHKTTDYHQQSSSSTPTQKLLRIKKKKNKNKKTRS
ncbi:unnamed protein product [Citrullus colocynthis]|uniref:Uncharacterized protein n=1 Tax=Citrullus colocynthis TaxID=252529 RepID=A0ABP0Y501_9ROSI